MFNRTYTKNPASSTNYYMYIYIYIGNERFPWISLDILIKRVRRPIDCRTLSNIFLPR